MVIFLPVDDRPPGDDGQSGVVCSVLARPEDDVSG